MKNILILITFVFLFTSCSKVVFDSDLEDLSPTANFDYLWSECDEKFSFFNVKDIDWNEVKTRYSNMIDEDMSQDSLFNVLGRMVNELKDDHSNLISNTNVSFFGLSNSFQDNFDWRIITDNYLGTNYYSTGPFRHDFLDNGEIGYIRFSSFTGTVNSTNLDFIFERYKDTKGLILDLRENGGGVANDIFQILGRFVENETLVYYSRIKNGPGHDDFTEPEAAMVSPYDGIRYTNKVMVLTDRGTYSAGSFTSLATKALPNLTLLGDTTGGGLGLPNGGQMPNGWSYRFSVTQALTIDDLDAQFENGVPPDIYQLFDWSDLSKDEILEKAIEELQ